MLVSDSFKPSTATIDNLQIIYRAISYLAHIDMPILLFVTFYGTNNGGKNLHPASWIIPGFLQYGEIYFSSSSVLQQL